MKLPLTPLPSPPSPLPEGEGSEPLRAARDPFRSMLHTVNKSPFERNTLESCLKHARPGAAVLLIEDGVYSAMQGTASAKLIQHALPQITVYVLQPDAETRGVADRLIEGIRLVDYGGFVDLAAEHSAVQSWL